MRNSASRTLILCLTLFTAFQVVGFLFANQRTRRRRRARRPVFSGREVERIFFKDVFAELVGPRPANLAAAAPAVVGPGPGGAAEAASPKGQWAALISATTIEDEIKSLKMRIDKDVTTPSDFAGRGYKACRQHMSILAALFGVVHEYDGDVRWKKDARAARDLFARTAANAKVGTPQVYNEAKLRKQDLQDLIGGSGVQSKPKPEPPTWGEIVDRSPLMQRLESSVETSLKMHLSSESEFKKNAEKVLHEAELVAVLSALLYKNGMEDGDDEDYAGFAKQMEKAASEVAEGVKLNDYERARKSIGAVDQACAACHELYRA